MGQISGGGMMAVIGLPPSRIERVLEESEAGRRVDVANFNSPEQTVLAGMREDLAAIEATLKAGGARACIVLEKWRGVHSLHARAHAPVQGLSRELRIRAAVDPVVANPAGLPYAPDVLHETLAHQIGHCVRWLDSVRFLVSQGVTDFEEVGPGTVLTKLVAQIRKSVGH